MSPLPDSFELVTIKLSPSHPWKAWILSDYTEWSGQPRRTYLGDLTYEAKYHGNFTALTSLREVVRLSVLQLRGFPNDKSGLARVTCVAAVPDNPAKKLSVPREVATTCADALGVADISSRVLKTRPLPPAKTHTASLPDAYSVDGDLVGEFVLLIDDVYSTGATLESVASNLRAAGAQRVVGLCVTKAHGGMK